jgi:hypothetical protein
MPTILYTAGTCYWVIVDGRRAAGPFGYRGAAEDAAAALSK